MQSKFGRRFLYAMVIVILASMLLNWLTGLWWPGLILLSAAMTWICWQLLRLEQLISMRGTDHGATENSRLHGIPKRIHQRVLLLEKHRRRQRRLLQSTVNELRFITGAFPEPAIMLDEGGLIVWFNPAAGRTLGLRRPDDHGQPLTNILRYPDFTTWLAEGRPQPIDISSTSNPNTKLNVRQFMLSQKRRLLHFRDVTELRNVEQVRRDFVANVSHELRTPLTVLIGYLETLQEDADSGVRMISSKMREQTVSMCNLIDDLIEISRLQSQPAERLHDVVDIGALMADLHAQAHSLNDRQHVLEFDYQPGDYLRATGKDLYSAFTNLITNAIRYTPAAGSIQISWRIEAGAAVFSVADNGTGIPREDIPRLTERFYRVSKDRSRASGGSGLGLAIVKHVLNAHDASLEIISELGRGSEFRCLFPLQRLVDKQGNPISPAGTPVGTTARTGSVSDKKPVHKPVNKPVNKTIARAS